MGIDTNLMVWLADVWQKYPVLQDGLLIWVALYLMYKLVWLTSTYEFSHASRQHLHGNASSIEEFWNAS